MPAGALFPNQRRYGCGREQRTEQYTPTAGLWLGWEWARRSVLIRVGTGRQDQERIPTTEGGDVFHAGVDGGRRPVGFSGDCYPAFLPAV